MNLIGKFGLVVILFAGSVPSRADELGRLFFTPQQRKQLEYQQQENNSAESRRVLTVNGIVQKTGGPRTVWINGVPQRAGNGNAHAPDSQHVAVPGQSQAVEVKVGQKVLVQPAGQ